MTIIGNLLLLIACFIYAGLLHIVYFERVPRGGDAVMGYAWSVILLNLVLLISMILVSLLVAARGGLAWIDGSGWKRFGWVSLVVLGGVLTATFSALFRYEPGPVPQILRFVFGITPLLIPPLLIASAGILLNQGIRDTTHPYLYKGPLLLVALFAALGILTGLFTWVVESGRRQHVLSQDRTQFEDSNTRRMLDDIDSCDVSKNMVFILVFADANQPPEVREKAVRKIKTHPNWQGEMVRLLRTEWAPEVFNFLASNEVDDPALLAQPVLDGMFQQAGIIQKRIQSSSHPSHFYPGLFSWEVERVIRTADRFDATGTNYLPALRAIRTALDEPSEFKKPVFNCVKELERSIKKREKS